MIAAAKLVGDLFAWLFYREELPIINWIGIAVLLINTVYLILSVLRRKKFCRNKNFAQKKVLYEKKP